MLFSVSICFTPKTLHRHNNVGLMVFINNSVFITKTCLYNFDPALTPLLYSKTRVYRGIHYVFFFLFFFFFFAKNIDCGYLLEPPRWGVSNEYTIYDEAVLTSTSIYVLSRNMTNIRIFIWKLSVLGGEIFNIYLNRRVFIMGKYILIFLSNENIFLFCYFS